LTEIVDASTTVLLICREGQSRRLYQEELDIPGIGLVCVQTLMEFFSRGVYNLLSGIFVDMPSYMRFSDEEKRLLTELVAIFPALRLKCNESSGEIRMLPFGSVHSGDITLAVFVQHYCVPFSQRRIRTCERSQLHMPVLLSRELPVEDAASSRCVTANISREGCFIICFEPWCVGDRGWLVLTELEDSAPVRIEVCWVQKWGEYRALPGMGVKFIEPVESQKSALIRLGGQNLMQEG